MSEVIKEFLVSLGFKVDPSSLGKFTQGVGLASKQVAELGAGVIATATAVEVGVAKMAAHFTDLYYASERTNSTVTALQSFEYAAKTIGVTSEQAAQSIENFSETLRSNPGMNGWLNQMGVTTKGRSDIEKYNSALVNLSKMPYYIAKQRAEQFGISGYNQQMYLHPQKFIEEQERMTKLRNDAGLNTKELSQQSRDYTEHLSHLEEKLKIVGEQIYNAFIGPADRVITFLDKATDLLIGANKATDGWAGGLAALVTTGLGALLAKFLLLKPFFRMIGIGGGSTAAASTTTTTAAVAGGASVIGSMLSGGLTGAPIAALAAMKHDNANGNPIRTWLRNKFGIKDDPKTAGDRNSIIDFFKGKDYTTEQAAGIAANLHRESRFNPNAVGDKGQAYGIMQWHKDRQKNFAKKFGHDIRQSTLEEQLEFVYYEMNQGTEQFAGRMLKRARTAGDAGAIFSKFNERPADQAGEMARRGGQAQIWADAYLGDQNKAGGAPVINQTTHVNVASNDPHTAAKKVADAQTQVNADIVRNVGAVTR